MLMAMSCFAFAAPLKNVEVRLTQPDGQVINCFASGDEFYNYLHDANGFTIVRGEGGYYYYATRDTNNNVVPSTYVVNSVDPASVGLQPYVKISKEEYYARRYEREKHIQRPQMRKKDRELNHGLYNNLVVFIRFAGDTYHTNNFSTVEAMFNADDYEANSLHNYYHHTSYNQLDLRSHFFPQPEGETILSYEDIYPKQYYQPYDPVTNPIGYQDGETADREFSMLERAINYIEDMVPYDIDLDYNGDGMVDNVVFVIKGEPGEWASLLWPHRWCIYDRYVPLHDLQVYDFNLQLEQGGYFNVSTLCHEMFHSLGAPDLYHYSGGIDPVGSWDLMCGTTEPPQQTNTYMKYKYGNWVDDIPVINSHGSYELEAVSWEGGRRNGYLISIGNPNQCFFVEYRDRNNVFESKIPDSGMLVYLIDTRFDGNASWNGNDYLDEVYLFRPGGTTYQAGNLDQAYFNEESGRTSFNIGSDPHPFIHNQPYDFYDWPDQITNIRKTGDRMCFDFMPYDGEGSAPGPENFVANVNSVEHQVELSWNANPNAGYYNVYRDGVTIAEVTDANFVIPYTEADHGFHIYSVLSVDSGLMHVYSAESKAWVILGDYETINLSIICDSPHGTKGGELEVSFDNPDMKSQYLTIYEGTHNEAQLQVPANTEVTFRWIAGFDPESQGIRVTATNANENGEETLFDLESPEAGVLATHVVPESGLGVMSPQHLTATAEDGNIHLHWTIPTESNTFSIYRDGICLVPSMTGYEFHDNRLARSGTYHYQVFNAQASTLSWNPDNQVQGLVMTYSCEPPQNLQGTHYEDSQPYNELTWEAPQFIGHGMLAYDDNYFVDQMGSKTQKFGIKIDPELLTVFEGLPLTHIEMFDCSAGNYTFKIHSGETPDNNNQIYSQTHEMTGSQTFVRFSLDEEVPFDTTLPLWICVEPNNVEHPAPYGEYVGVPNSCMVRVGGQWRPITYYSQYLSWLLRTYTATAPGRDLSYKVYVGPEEAEDYQMSILYDNVSITQVTHQNNENLRYNVTAIWDGKETGFSNSVFLGPSVNVEEQMTLENDCFAYINNGHLIINGEGTVQVIDLMGRQLFSREVHSDFRLPTSCFPASGIYVLRLFDNNQVKTQKIVVSEN